MPRYFFHIRDGWNVIPDEEGMDFANLGLAEVEGRASAHDLAAAALFDGHNLAAYAVEVTGEDGIVLSRINVESMRRFAS